MKKYIVLWLATLLVYLFISSKGSLVWKTRQESYFNLQAYSWLQGRLDLVAYPISTFDLSIFHGKVYTYWPPLPAIFVIPFVYIFGILASDIFYTSIFGSFGCVLMLLALEGAEKAGLVPKAKKHSFLLLSIFFSFGTVFFYLANVGSVWFTSQIVSIEMLLISLIFLFKFASGKKNSLFIVSIFFLCLAFWARNTLLLAVPIHLYILLMVSQKKRAKLILTAGLLLLLSIIGFGIYNFIRFGSFTENGLRYQTFNPRWSKDVQKYGLSNIHYLPHNIYYFLLSPLKVQPDFPYIQADPEGNGIFYTSPFFLALFGLIAADIYKRKNRAGLVFLATGLLLIFSQLFYYGTGWVQFGYRYALDGIPFLILALAWVFGIMPSIILYLLFLLSVVINTFGVFWMQKMTEKLLY